MTTRHVVTVIADRTSLRRISNAAALRQILERAGGRAEDLVTIEVLGARGYQLLPPVSGSVLTAMPAVPDPGPPLEADLARVAANLYLTSATLAVDGLSAAFLVVWLAANQHTRLSELTTGLALGQPAKLTRRDGRTVASRTAANPRRIVDGVMAWLACLLTVVAVLTCRHFGPISRLVMLWHCATQPLAWQHSNGANRHATWTPLGWALLGLVIVTACSVLAVAVQLGRLHSPRRAALTALIFGSATLTVASELHGPLATR